MPLRIYLRPRVLERNPRTLRQMSLGASGETWHAFRDICGCKELLGVESAYLLLIAF